jgi:hypothetical protein
VELVGSLHRLRNRVAVVTNACGVENAKEIVNVAETIALLEKWRSIFNGFLTKLSY